MKNEKKKEQTKRSAEYLHKVQVCWYDKTDLAIDSNKDPITLLKEYAVIVGMVGHTLYKYCCANKLKRQSIGIIIGPNSTLMTNGDVNFMGDVLVRSDRGNNGMRLQEAIYAMQ